MRYLTVEVVPIADLDHFPGNARTGAVDKIRESVRRFGQFRSVLVREADPAAGRPRRVIVAGNHTIMAMLDEGHLDARVEVIETADDDEASRINAADNRMAELGGYDPVLLAAQLDAFGGDYAGTGWTAGDLHELRPPDPPGDPDDIPPPPARLDVITRTGDVWQLGAHRLVCGDVRDPAVIAALMDGDPVHLAITSPPYADRRVYDEASDFRPVPPGEYVDWWEAVQAAVASVVTEDASFFVNIKPGVTPDGLDTELYVADLVTAMVRRWGWHFATELCWERPGVPKAVIRRFKNQFEPVYQFTRGPWRTFPGEVAGKATAGRFGSLFEPIYQFTRGEWKMRPETVRHASDAVPVPGTPGASAFGAKGFHVDAHQGEQAAGRAAHEADWDRRAAAGQLRTPRQHPTTGAMSDAQGTPAQPGTHTMAGLAYPGNRLPTFAGTHEATGHTAAFPVGLPRFLIRAYSDHGDTVLDPFAGSGSTLIAAHLEGRAGYAAEISPVYCDIIVRRFERLTGIKATRGDL